MLGLPHLAGSQSQSCKCSLRLLAKLGTDSVSLHLYKGPVSSWKVYFHSPGFSISHCSHKPQGRIQSGPCLESSSLVSSEQVLLGRLHAGGDIVDWPRVKMRQSLGGTIGFWVKQEQIQVGKNGPLWKPQDAWLWAPTPAAPHCSPSAAGTEECPALLPPGCAGASGSRVCPGVAAVWAHLYVPVLPPHWNEVSAGGRVQLQRGPEWEGRDVGGTMMKVRNSRVSKKGEIKAVHTRVPMGVACWVVVPHTERGGGSVIYHLWDSAA